MEKDKQEKIDKFIGLFILFFLVIFAFLYLRVHNYKIEYKVNKYKVYEQFYKNDKKYLIRINVEGIDFSFSISEKYHPNKKIINSVEVTNEEGLLCVKPIGKKITTYAICYQDGEYKTNHAKEFESKITQKHKNINIYDTNNKVFFLWNYDSFVYVNDNNIKEIQVAEKELYNIKNVFSNDTLLFVPYQDNNYTFNKAYIINSKNGKSSTIKFNYDLHFDSYYPGYDKNNIYLVDRKNKQEYKIDLKKKETEKISGTILNKNNWQKVSITKLINKDYLFNYNKVINYELLNQELYAVIDNKKISVDQNITSIIKENGYEVYYLKDDTLYSYSFLNGYKKLIAYSEWKFNNKDMIYIFD